MILSIRIFLAVLFTQIVFAFDQNKLPNDIIVVAADGSGQYISVKYNKRKLKFPL